MVEALLLTCRLEVTSDLVGPIRDEGGGRFRVTLEPALDKTDRDSSGLHRGLDDRPAAGRRRLLRGQGSLAVALLRDLHLHPPMTVGRMHAAHRWILPAAAILVAVLAVGAVGGWLFWDEPITNWVVEARTPALDHFFRRVSFLGSTAWSSS